MALALTVLITMPRQEYQFRNIAKAEWANLLAFLKEKPMRIVNFDEATQGPTGGRGIMDFAGDDIDAGARSALTRTSRRAA
jgi:hypothetical protein